MTVGQCHNQRRASNRRRHRGGVHHGAALDHAWSGGQGHRAGIEGVADVGHGLSRVDCEVLEVTTGGTSDGRFDLAGVFVNVISRGGDGYLARGLAGRDVDGRAVAQGHGHRRAGGIAQRGGIDDLTAFGDIASGAQHQVGRGLSSWAIGDRGGWSTCGIQLLVITAVDLGDAVGQRGVGVVDVVWRGEVDRAGRLADADDDGLAVS
ncbi:hypothetical protein D3C78_1141670 [compost metagenome]